MIECVAFKPEHALFILGSNEEAGITLPMKPEDIVKSYTFPGSIAMTMMKDGEPIACGGIINMAWHRGEAWILTLSTFRMGKESWPVIRSMFSVMAEIRGFIRVQATSYQSDKCAIFKHLLFEYEGAMSHFGVAGETGYLYSRIFNHRSDPCPQ